MKNITNKLILASTALCVSFTSIAKTFTPQTSDDVLTTPHRGFMVWGTSEGKYPDSLNTKHYPSSIYHVYLPWRLLEPSDQNFQWKTIETHYLKVISNLDPNATFVLRVVADYPDGESSEIDFKYTGGDSRRDYPLFLEGLGIARKPYDSCDGDGPGVSLDWNHPEFAKQTEQLIVALANKFDNDKRITAIQLGIVGMWGEWHQTGCDWAPKDSIKQLIANTYQNAFTSTPLQIRYAGETAKGKDFGFYEDAFPRLTAICNRDILRCEDGGTWNLEYGLNNVATDAKNNWQVSPISGETPEFYGLQYPNSQTVIDSKYWQNMWTNTESPKIIKLIKDFHFSFLGPAGRHNRSIESVKGNMDALHNVLGYRFQLNHLTVSDIINPDNTTISFEMAQVGSAPSYFDTRLMLDWLDKQGSVVKTTTLSENLQSLLPADIKTFTETHRIELPEGEYELRAYLSMRQPIDVPIALANTNRDDKNRLILGNVTIMKPKNDIKYTDSFE